MKRITVSVFVVVMVAFVLTGCQWLLATRVDAIRPKDLASYTASQTFMADEQSVLEALGSAGGAASSGPGTVFDTQVADELGYTTEDSTFRAVFNGLVQHSIETARSAALAPARTVTVTDDSDFSDENNPKIDVSIDISNETVHGTELGGTGSATIESFYLGISGSGTATDTTASFDAKGEQNGVFRYTNWNDGASSVTIHDGQVNSKGNARIRVYVEESGVDDVSGNLFWNFGYAMNAGFSVSDSSTGRGGKIIVNFRYWGRENIDFSSSAELETEATGAFEAEMTVRIYDNNDTLIAEHTYTDEDVYETTSSF